MASYRYRAMIPAEQIGADINNPDAEVLVFSKPTSIKAVKDAKDQGKKIVVDFCDDHFDHPGLGEVYRRIAELADHFVCPTETMRGRVLEVARWPTLDDVSVIPDPYEMPEMQPHAEGEALLWFGHNANIGSVSWLLKQFKNLTVVTGPKVEGGMVPWSPENLKQEMRKANIALFPTAKDHYYKSPNRLVNALRMGLFPVCDRHPAYNEFKEFIWISEVPTGIKWCREFKKELNEMVWKGQDYIRDRFSPETIGKQWAEVLA